MRGGMAGGSVHEKENTQVRGSGGKAKERRRSSGGSARRLSVSGSKSRPHYLRAVSNRFRRMGGCGRGRITAHRPVHFDGSPYEFSLRSDSEGDRRKSFVVFEDDVDSVSSKSRRLEPAIQFEASGTIQLVAGPKNDKLENCRTPNSQDTGEQNASRAPLQQGSKYHVLEDFVAFRARNNSMFSSKLRPRRVAPLVEPADQQASGSRPCLEILAARWQRGGARNLFTQRSLDTCELEDLEETFKRMDEEDLERETLKKFLEMEMHKYDLEYVVLPRDQQEHEVPFVAVETSEPHATVMVPLEAQASVGDLAPQPSSSQKWEPVSPRIGGLETESGGAHVDLATPLLNDPKENQRLDQTVPFSGAPPANFELGVSPDASDYERAITQFTPPAIQEQTPPASLPLTSCNNEDLDTVQQIPVEVESEIAQTVEAVQVWSVELDPSRRRRETMERYSNRRSPWIKTLVLSSFQPANQLPDGTIDSVLRKAAVSMDHFDRVTPLNVSRPLSPLRSSEFVLTGPAKNLVESYEGNLLSTNLPFSSGKGLNRKEGDVEIIDSRVSTCPGHATVNEFEAHVPLTENGQDMQALNNSPASLSNSRSSWPDESPVRRTDLSAECMESLHEKTSESSLEPPTSQSAEPLRRVDVKATPTLVQSPIDTTRISPTPPRNLSLVFGDPFGQMSGEELSRRWLQFCTTPPVMSDAFAGKKKSWNVESAVAEPMYSERTTSFLSEQVLERTTEADVLPIADEDAVSSEGLHGKTPTQDEDVLPDAEGQIFSSDGSDGAMDYENDFDDISNDTTCIVQTGASSADNDQEGMSALKECPEEDARDAQDAPIGEDMLCMNLTPRRDNNSVKAAPGPAVEATPGPAVEYSLTHVDEGHIDQFVKSLQVTPGVDESCVERPTSKGESASLDPAVDQNHQPPGNNAGHLSTNKELITPEKNGNRLSVEAQGESTPVQEKPKTKRARKSTRIKKVDSPLDAGTKWSNGQRVSTRIKSKPLDWWRGERMLYGRVHSSLNTLIGIKHLSPDPVWPRPRDRKNKMEPPKFRVDSFVSDEHKELLRLAAQ